MAIFGKNKERGESDIDFEPMNSTMTHNSVSSASSSSYNSPGQLSYGIQDAIKLIRKLPNVNTDMVVTVVIKTLESANIQVDEIINDAQQREDKIESRSTHLISKIEDLESQIAELNSEITELNAEMEETSQVK